MKKLLLIRHGENLANLTKEFSYKLVDYPLTSKGRLQAEQTASHLANWPFHSIYTSPLKRARETAEIIAASSLLEPVIVEGLREVNVGSLEVLGATEESWSIYRNVLQQWSAGDSDCRFPEGESGTNAFARFQAAIESICQDDPGETIVVVGHGTLFAAGMSHLFPTRDSGYYYNHDNPNCSISRIKVTGRGTALDFELECWADATHLFGEAAKLVAAIPQAHNPLNRTAGSMMVKRERHEDRK